MSLTLSSPFPAGLPPSLSFGREMDIRSSETSQEIRSAKHRRVDSAFEEGYFSLQISTRPFGAFAGLRMAQMRATTMLSRYQDLMQVLD
jgi:hypothetical protein